MGFRVWGLGFLSFGYAVWGCKGIWCRVVGCRDLSCSLSVDLRGIRVDLAALILLYSLGFEVLRL